VNEILTVLSPSPGSLLTLVSHHEKRSGRTPYGRNIDQRCIAPDKERTMKARKWAVAGVTAGLLAGGSAGFLMSVPGGAGAATSRTSVTPSDVDGESADDGVIMGQHHGAPHRSPEARGEKLTEVLQGLVDFGVINTAERDAIVSALTTKPENPPTERPDPGTMLNDRLQTLVDDGTLTAEQRDAVVTTIQDARPAPGEFKGRGDRGGRRGPGRGAHLETAATVIGVTADDLKAALQSGQSIADVATANGVDPQTVIDALVAEATSNMTQRITDMVNGVRPAGAPADPAN